MPRGEPSKPSARTMNLGDRPRQQDGGLLSTSCRPKPQRRGSGSIGSWGDRHVGLDSADCAPHRRGPARSCGACLRVAPEDVQIITPGSDRDTSTARVVVDVAPASGDFSALVDVDADPDLEARASLEGLAHLCSALGLSAFVGDDSANPASGTLVSDAGRVAPAMIDPAAENDGQYRLIRSPRNRPPTSP